MSRVQAVALRRGGRDLLVDDKRPRSAAAFATLSPVVVFHPGEIALSSGAGSERRRLLDRVALFSSPAAADDLARYTRAVRSRQSVLESRGPSSSDLQEWESLAAHHGLRVVAARRAALDALRPRALATFAELMPACSLELEYVATAPETEDAFAAALRAGRSVDVRRRSASIGPHRDDLRVLLEAKPSRRTSSQGQHRSIVLSLKIAELDAVSRLSASMPVLLLDDVSSELDPTRSRSLFELLSRATGQVVLSTTRPEIISTVGERRDFAVDGGRVSSV